EPSGLGGGRVHFAADGGGELGSLVRARRTLSLPRARAAAALGRARGHGRRQPSLGGAAPARRRLSGFVERRTDRLHADAGVRAARPRPRSELHGRGEDGLAGRDFEREGCAVEVHSETTAAAGTLARRTRTAATDSG